MILGNLFYVSMLLGEQGGWATYSPEIPCKINWFLIMWLLLLTFAITHLLNTHTVTYVHTYTFHIYLFASNSFY